MGIYDREYSREREPGFHVTAPTTATIQLVILTVGVYIAQILFVELTNLLELRWDWWRRPWEAYRLLTYGFAHSPTDIRHIVFNMLSLGIFGRIVEPRYGRTRLLIFYLGAIIFSGLVWSLLTSLSGEAGSVIGASGATTAIVVLFALNYPRMEVQLMFLFPMPAWVLGIIIVAGDIHGAVSRSGNTAFTAHLAGALFGLYFYARGSTHAAALAGRFGNVSLRRKPRLRVHEPDQEDELNEKVDAILKKIKEQGQDSLTWNERRLLEKASRRYQEKRK
jgi:membrane associated rhomboid family serine protease